MELEEQQQPDNIEEEEHIPNISNLIQTNSFVDRYFKRYYTPPPSHIQQYLYLHTNGVVLVGVTARTVTHFPAHFRVSFDCISKVTSDLVKGKKKSKNGCTQREESKSVPRQ